jgi:tRNA A-37 threonylcarbamoyl transferase component Bud32
MPGDDDETHEVPVGRGKPGATARPRKDDLVTLPPDPRGPNTMEIGLGEHARVELVSAILEPGSVLGAYRVVKLLGKGGMGEVYLALHTTLGKKVALKLLRSSFASDRDAVRRFFKEARAACRAEHPNIVAITDFIENEAGNCFYVMEYLDGETLGERIERGPLSLVETLHIGEQICDALTALHRAGVVHRDLKPANIFLVERKGRPLVKVLDFGLVKLTGEPTVDQTETDPGTVIGTPEYMSPEQVRAVRDIDHRSDLYALGTILYEMATGQRPLQADAVRELLIKVVTVEPTPPSRIAGLERPLPHRLETLIMSCLAKDRDRRPRTAQELLEQLRAITAAVARPGAAGPWWRWPLLGVALGMVATALMALLLLKGGRGEEAAPPRTAQKRVEQPVAVLQDLWGSVEHRPREKKRWAAAARQMALRHLDGLRTGAGAHARVAFLAGPHLDVDERSEILMEAPVSGAPDRPAPRLTRLRRGTVRAVVQPGEPLRIVTTDGKTTDVAAPGGRRIVIRARVRAGGGLELTSLDGTAEITSGGRSMQLPVKQVVDVIGGRPGRPMDLLPFPELERPAVDQEVLPAVSLAWRAVGGAASYRVQVSASTVFDDKLVDEVRSKTRLDITLDPGTFVWRVSSVDALAHEGEFGFARRFRVVQQAVKAAPGLTLPREDAVVLVGTRPKRVAFRWSVATEDGADSVLVVARSPALRRRVVARRRVRDNTATLSLGKPGIYYWGVFVVDGRGKRVALHQRARRLILRRTPPPGIKLPAIEWR